jgi:glycosyltransferase involved in cell wall biosynthesis
VEFLKNVYKLPELKCDLLVIGADDERVILAKEEITKRKVRERHNIAMDEFVIITGGKIDSGKKQILLLIRAISALRLANVKLLVFGSVINHLRDELFALVDNDRIQYIGWLESDEVYDYFGASDLAVFPGGHSVLWEQAVAVGIPCVFKYWNGMTHVDVGGNCKFIYNDTVEEISNILIGIINDRDVHSKMKKVAEEKGLKTFSYKEIARRAIQLD